MSKSPLEHIESDPHVIAVLPGEDWTLPSIDYRAFHRPSHGLVQRAVDTLQGFVRAHYVIDSFGDHAERRVWLARLSKKHGEEVGQWYNEQNCLRYGTVGKITCPDSMLELHILNPYVGPKRADLINAARSITSIHLGGNKVYDQKSPVEKVRYVMDVKERVHDLLRQV